MARQILLLALVLFAVVALASVEATTNPVASSPSDGGDDDDVGTLDVDSEAAPVGGPVPEGVFTTTTNTPAPSPNGGAATLEVSVVGGVAAAVAVAFFL